MKTTPSCVLWGLLILIVTPAAGRAADKWQFGSAPSFSSGKYGTDTRTEVLHMPITARRLFGDGDVTFVFPFTCIWGNGGVTIVDGLPVRQERIRAAAASDTRAAASTDRSGRTTGGSQTGSSDAITSASRSSETARNCGAGDIVVRGRYYLLDERRWMPTIALRAHVKTPTANADRGLGTGRPDEGFGIEVSRTLPSAVLAMIDGGYTFIGKPVGADFNNTWWYDVGVGKNLAGAAVNLSVFFEEYRAIVPGFANARDVLAAVTVAGANGWRIQISGEFGLSDGAPDHGFTIGANRRF